MKLFTLPLKFNEIFKVKSIDSVQTELCIVTLDKNEFMCADMNYWQNPSDTLHDFLLIDKAQDP